MIGFFPYLKAALVDSKSRIGQGLREYLVLTENRIPLKQVLGDVRIVAISIILREKSLAIIYNGVFHR